MTAPVPPVGTLVGRIASIETRFSTSGAPAGGLRVLGSATRFDPFGAVYQAALDAVAADQVAPASTTPDAALLGVVARRRFEAAGLRAPSPATGGPTAEQIGAAVAGLAGPPGVRPPGGYGAMPVPAELAVYPNGQLPDGALQRLSAQPNHRLAPPAAAAWDSLVAAAATDGISMRITDSYRSYAEQVDLAERKGLYSQGGLAATPGKSNHGWGLAVDADVTDPATLRWLRVNGPRFGFVETSDREPWHWEFRPHQV